MSRPIGRKRISHGACAHSLLTFSGQMIMRIRCECSRARSALVAPATILPSIARTPSSSRCPDGRLGPW